MSLRPILAALAVLVAGCFNPRFGERLACGPDGECPPGQTCAADGLCHAPGDPIPDAPSGAHADAPRADAPIADAPVADARPDAAPPDAPPVGCQGNPDCATPPDLCSMAGTCNLATHTCSYPPVVCTQLDSDCAKGVCDPSNGTCVAMARNENASCGAGTVCGPFGTCGGFADACAESGVQSRACTVNTCHAGACTGASTTDTASCVRGSTDGTVCGGTSAVSCASCAGFTDVCAEDGQQTCTCVTPVCAGGTCSGNSDASCVQGCTRDTNGVSCGPTGHKCLDGLCECTTC
jgi:hypothetical protein